MSVLTLEQLNELKRVSNLTGIEIPWDDKGEVEEWFAVAFLIGQGAGKVLQTKGTEKFSEVVNSIKDTSGVSVGIKKPTIH